MLQLVLIIGSAGTCMIWGDCTGSGLVGGADMNMCSPDCNSAGVSDEYICAPGAGGVRGAVGIVCVSLFSFSSFLSLYFVCERKVWRCKVDGTAAARCW